MVDNGTFWQIMVDNDTLYFCSNNSNVRNAQNEYFSANFSDNLFRIKKGKQIESKSDEKYFSDKFLG